MTGSAIFLHVISPGWIISHGSKAYCRFGLPRVFGPGRETLNLSIEERCRGFWTGVAPLSPALSRAGEIRQFSARKKSNNQDDQTKPLTENTSDEHIRNHNRWWRGLTSFFDKKPPTPSLDDSIQILEFPFDKEGNQQKEILKEYKDTSGQPFMIKYLDIHIGSGDCVENNDIRKLHVVFDYYLYDSYQNRVNIRKSKSKSSHEKRDLCKHEFGTGFNEGIRGMRAGGIRRFIVPVKLLPKGKGYTVKGDYAVFDVKLLKVSPSIACWLRIEVFGAEN